MNPENGSFSRCVKHPSQIFTGFCSFCLAERLSSVDSAESNPRASCSTQSEIVEISLPAPDLEKPGDVKLRKTLLSLFELDDRNAVKNSTSGGNVGSLENGYECESHVTHDLSFDLGTRVLESRVGHETRGSSSYSARVAEKVDPLEDESLKDKGNSFRLSSMFSNRTLRWRTRNSSKKNQMQEWSSDGGFGDRQLESKVNSRHSCDWSLCRDSGKAWEVPRHSWDGSTVSKAFTCSFACIDEPHDGSCRTKRRVPELATSVDPVSSNENVDVNKVDNATLDQEKPSSSDVNLGSILKERHQYETHHEISVSGVSRKKSHRWSKVWDWNIASPFRDLVKKRNHVLDRSLSESWREGRKDKNMETVEPDGRAQFYGNGHSSARTNQCLNRSINSVNGDLQSGRLDWKKKKEFKFGRSRSVHYSSPGNFESGLLRFYLTPLRSSRRSTSKGRTKSSRSFARGFLGIY